MYLDSTKRDAANILRRWMPLAAYVFEIEKNAVI